MRHTECLLAGCWLVASCGSGAFSDSDSATHGSHDEGTGGYYESSPGNSGGHSQKDPPAQTQPPAGEPGPQLPPECEDDAPATLYLSADDSNSQASPVLARRLINDGRYVPARLIRTYEFLNYADFDYPAPTSGLSMTAELRPSTVQQGQYDLQIGVRAPDMQRSETRQLNVVLVLDSSGSMAGPPMELLRSSVRVLLDQLLPSDRVSVVRLSAHAELLVDGTSPKDIDEEALFAQLTPDGVTDLHAALQLAYAQAALDDTRTTMTRVVLMSDGAANAGITDIELIAEHAGTAREEGVYLIGVGVGEGYNDSLMDAVTDAGKGSYFYVDSEAEAQRMLGDRFVSNFELAALDVRVALDLPAGWEMVVFRGEEISTDPEAVRPQNLAPNDQMVFNQTLGTCASDAASGDETFHVRATYTDAASGTERVEEIAATLTQLLEAPAHNLDKGMALVAFAETLVALDPFGAEATDVAATCESLLAELSSVEADDDIESTLSQAAAYCTTVRDGQFIAGSCDCGRAPGFAAALGLCDDVVAIPRHGAADTGDSIWGSYETLGNSTTVRAKEGCRFAALSTGHVGESTTIPGHARSCGDGPGSYEDPAPHFYGSQTVTRDGATICDLAQVQVELTAPADARSFSFDFSFFSAEYPEYIGSQFNDTFYAILAAASTNDGQATNISFDSLGAAIEINNNYFANPYHPCSEAGTGFVTRASTCWLRTSWPIEPGETFTLIFSVHDEGDAIYSSTALLDNFVFHPYPAVGMTDPLN